MTTGTDQPAPAPAAPGAVPPPVPPPALARQLPVAGLLPLVQAVAPGATRRVLGRSESLLVPADQLLAAARLLRDDPRLAFDQLRCLSGLDTSQLGDPKRLGPVAAKTAVVRPSDEFAVVTHLRSTVHGHGCVLVCAVPRGAPAMPSLGGLWPVAGWFEREAFDLFGIAFTGHPDLRRILLPEDWVGHPGRRDYAYPRSYGGVDTRRDGQHFDDGPYADADPAPAAPAPRPAPLPTAPVAAAPPAAMHLAGDTMTIHLGPHHPATHGVLHFELETDGEVVLRARPDIGYLHRSIEKIGEFLELPQFVCYTDRVDYVCAMNANLAYCYGVERLFALDPATAIVVPERGEGIRVLVAELNRISSHLIAVGAMGMDIGAFTPFLHAIAQREAVNDLFERTCGARLTYNYVTIGGVERDLHPGAEGEIAAFLDQLERELARFNRLITTNTIFRDRCAGVAVVDAPTALAYGLVGANLRGSGVAWDIRKDEPYGLYGQLDFEVPVGDNFAGRHGARGDAYDRYIVRCLEMLESIRLCRQVLKRLPPPAGKATDPVGGWQADVAKIIRKPPAGEVYIATEAPRGEMGYYLVSDGGKTPYRIKIRTGSFTALSLFERLLPGHFIADVVAIIGSFDIVVPEVDR